MKILLTHGYFIKEDPKEQLIMKPYPPLGILYISAYLQEKGFDNTVLDSTFSTFDSILEKIKNEKPEIIAFYTNLMTKVNVLKMVKEIKNCTELADTLVVLGGPEVTHHKANFLAHGADLLVIGEGEVTMAELAELVSKKEDYKNIAGIAYRNEKGEVITNEGRAKIKDIDTLPMPARHNINLSEYINTWKTHHGHGSISVSTMRGCPYTCKWCSRAVYGLSYRRRSAALVVSELQTLQKTYGCDTFWFVDDVFTISHKWLQEFADEVAKNNLKIRYEAISRADRMNEEVIALLKKSGCFRIWIGAESGSQTIIDAMDRRVDVKQVQQMIQLSRKAGIEAGTFIMLGYPGETRKDIEDTVEHLVKSNPSHFTVTVTYPIKGTELYTEVEASLYDIPEWETSTDRELNFKREHPKKYYQSAAAYVTNEVKFRQHLREKKIDLGLLKLKLKSVIAQTKMMLYATKD